jgi:hypothetical protein
MDHQVRRLRCRPDLDAGERAHIPDRKAVAAAKTSSIDCHRRRYFTKMAYIFISHGFRTSKQAGMPINACDQLTPS